MRYIITFFLDKSLTASYGVVEQAKDSERPNNEHYTVEVKHTHNSCSLLESTILPIVNK